MNIKSMKTVLYTIGYYVNMSYLIIMIVLLYGVENEANAMIFYMILLVPMAITIASSKQIIDKILEKAAKTEQLQELQAEGIKLLAIAHIPTQLAVIATMLYIFL